MDNKLLMVLQSYAPTGTAQQKCINMVWNAERYGATPKEVEKTLINALADGVNHGNWPWN
jgi:hypothetical protein